MFEQKETTGKMLGLFGGKKVQELEWELPLHQIFKSFPEGPSGSRQIDFFRRVYAEVPNFPAERPAC